MRFPSKSFKEMGVKELLAAFDLRMRLLLDGVELTAEGETLEALGCQDGCVLHVEEGPADAVSDFDMPVASPLIPLKWLI